MARMWCFVLLFIFASFATAQTTVTVLNVTAPVPADVWLKTIQECTVHYSCIIMVSLASVGVCEDPEYCMGAAYVANPICANSHCNWKFEDYVPALNTTLSYVDVSTGNARHLLVGPGGVPETAREVVQLGEVIAVQTLVGLAVGAGIAGAVAGGTALLIAAGVAAAPAAAVLTVGGILLNAAVDQAILKPDFKRYAEDRGIDPAIVDLGSKIYDVSSIFYGKASVLIDANKLAGTANNPLFQKLASQWQPKELGDVLLNELKTDVNKVTKLLLETADLAGKATGLIEDERKSKEKGSTPTPTPASTRAPTPTPTPTPTATPMKPDDPEQDDNDPNRDLSKQCTDRTADGCPKCAECRIIPFFTPCADSEVHIDCPVTNRVYHYCCPSGFEQVSPSPSPSPVVTATPSPDVTSTPSPVITGEPSPDVTSIPSPVVTGEPSPAATQAPSPVVTAAATPTEAAT